jgi:hypothetical protein
MIVLADPQEAAERHERIDRLTTHLVDHDVVHSTELVALQVVDVRALDLLGRDQGVPEVIFVMSAMDSPCPR